MHRQPNDNHVQPCRHAKLVLANVCLCSQFILAVAERIATNPASPTPCAPHGIGVLKKRGQRRSAYVSTCVRRSLFRLVSHQVRRHDLCQDAITSVIGFAQHIPHRVMLKNLLMLHTVSTRSLGNSFSVSSICFLLMIPNVSFSTNVMIGMRYRRRCSPVGGYIHGPWSGLRKQTAQFPWLCSMLTGIVRHVYPRFTFYHHYIAEKCSVRHALRLAQ